MTVCDSQIRILTFPKGLEEAAKAQGFRGDFPTFLRDASVGPLKWPFLETFKPLGFSINKVKSSCKFVAQDRSLKCLPTSQSSLFKTSFADTESSVIRDTVNQNHMGNQDQSRKYGLPKIEFLLRVRHVFPEASTRQ